MKPVKKTSSYFKNDRSEERESQPQEKSSGGKWAVPIVATLLAGLITFLVTQLQLNHQDEMNERSKLEVFYADTVEHLERINMLFKKACLVPGSKEDDRLVESLSNYRSRYQTFKGKLDTETIAALEHYGEVVAESLFAYGMSPLEPSQNQGPYEESYKSYLEAKNALAKLLPLLSKK